MKLHERLSRSPFLPYIRESDYAVRPVWHFAERRLLDYLLVYFQEGHCVFHIDGEEYHFFPGDFCLAQPGSLKSMRGLTPTVTPFVHFDIFYHSLREQSFPTRMGQTDLTDYMHLMQPRLNDIEGIDIPARLQPSNPEQLAADMLAMIGSWRSGQPLGQMEAQALASRLIVQIIEDHSMNRPAASEPAPSFGWLPSFLSLHLADPITIEDMAERAHLSASRFNAVFKKHYGVSPHQYLLNLRIEHAKELLRNTDYTIEKTAAYCGFADIHHFSKIFKKKCGIPPTTYRLEERRRT